MHRYIVILVVTLATANTASANTWADGLFDSLSKDFGSVPRGQVISHPFRIINKTGSPIRIAGVRVSCGCVTAYPLKNYLAPGQETALIAEMDTRRFHHSRTVTIYVSFDMPEFAEVRLWIRANSREDVSIFPETFAFGQIKRGASPAKSVSLSLLGNSNLRVLKVWADSNYVRPTYRLTQQTGHEVTYDLKAQLRPDTPPGRWYTDVWIATNNPALPQVRIPLTVEVKSALSVSPNLVLLGKVQTGSAAVRKITVRGVQPFRIVGVKGVDKQLTIYGDTSQKAAIHVLTLTLRPSRTGEFQRTVHIQTDMEQDNHIDFTTRAFVVP